MTKTALVISYQGDAHVELLMRKARDRGINAVLWDVSKYPANGSVSLEIDNNSTDSRIWVDGEGYDTSDIQGVWWRRPGGAQSGGPKSRMRQYISVESEFVVRSLRDFLVGSSWISDPEATRLACRKPVQLYHASQVGLKIPATCVTNSPDALLSFLESMKGRGVIMKPVGSAFMPLDPDGQNNTSNNKVVYTKIVDPAVLLENIGMVKNCPVIFQEAIPKDYDVRVTVVDHEVFAASIRLEGFDDPANLDWRNHAGTRVYSHHVLPDEIRAWCTSVVSRLGLRFGCIDLGFSEKDGYTFFEINPQGQWLPSELKLGYNISGAILDSLTR